MYVDIIKDLIINEELNGTEKTFSIFQQLDLENIHLNDYMKGEVNNVLNEGEEYVKKYKIENLDDFSDTEKINFFYYLLKYIIKLRTNVFMKKMGNRK